jgi:probable HAF family extracellular repeat protein
MQPKIQRSLFLALLTIAFAMVTTAQQAPMPPTRHLRYKLVDLGTFGGPHSLIPAAQRDLTRSGAVVGIAETDIPDPFAPNCLPNCVVQQAFTWRDGVMTKLLGFIPNLESGAQALNESGIVVGESQNGLIDPATGAPTIHAVLWRKGHLLDLGTLGGNSSGALSINSRGQVIGTSQTTIPDPISGFTQWHAFLWENGLMRDLGTLGGPFSFGGDVNDRGQAGGVSLTAADPQTGESATHVFVWENGRLADLSLGGTFAEGPTLNNRGQAVGHSTLPGDLEDHAFLWDGERTADLGTLGGTFSLPTGLSEKGNVSGVATTTNDDLLHAVLWRNQKILDLGTVPRDGCSWGWGLNSRDQVVGISLPFPCDFSVAHAFLWEDGEMVDLNTLISPASDFTLVYATGINDAGEIVGSGVPGGVSPADVDTLGHAFVLTPIHGDTTDAPVNAAAFNSRVVAVTAIPADAQKITERIVAKIRAQQRRRYQRSGATSR